EAQGAERCPQQEAGEPFAENDADALRILDLTQSETADDGSDGLAAGVAAGADHERYEIDQVGQAELNVLEEMRYVLGERSGQEQEQEPAYPPAHGLDDPPLPLGL